MILHFSHIGLTDGRTFTLASLVSYLSSSLGLALAAADGGQGVEQRGVVHVAGGSDLEVADRRLEDRSVERRREAAKPSRTSTLSKRHSSIRRRFSPVMPG